MARSELGSVAAHQVVEEIVVPEDFDRRTSEARFIAAVQAGLDDHGTGSVVSHEELGRRLDARFGTLPKTKK